MGAVGATGVHARADSSSLPISDFQAPVFSGAILFPHGSIRMNGKFPPGPRDGLCGITFHGPLRADPLGFAMKIAREYGDFAAVRIGWVRLYFVSRPELIREVLATKVKSFPKLTRQMRALRKIEGDGLVVSEGSTWTRHRPAVQGSFHARHFGRFADTVVACTRRRLGRWRPGEPFDLSAEMNELALEIIARLVFDVDVADQAASLRDAVHIFRQAMQREVSSPLVLPNWLPLPGKIRQRRAVRAVDDLIWRLIRERRASGAARQDMLSQILAAAGEHPELDITDPEVRDEVATLFVAGHDTTSAALAWLWFALSQHPTVERRVLQEVDLLGNRPLGHADFPRLKYLEMVVKESMRLYPATGLLFGREAAEDVELGGYPVKRGSWLFIAPYVVQRDARYFPNPEVFDPERFAPGRVEQILPYTYIPFGGGPRICIGNSLATMELVLLAATILQQYRLTLDQPPPEMEMEIVLRPKGGLRMRAQPRQGEGKIAGAA
jgi:cytochrome P450